MLSGNEMNEQGILWYKAGNYKEAKRCWDVSAEQGNASSMFCLGILSLSAGDYDIEVARMWFEKAALAGHKNAKYQLEHLSDGLNRSYMADNILCVQPLDFCIDLKIETVKFGNREWMVLKKDSEKTLYLSKYIIDIRKYHNSEMPITWETSDIRRWLNSEFYDGFSFAEKRCIYDSYIANNKNPVYATNGGKDTLDRCFLLSYEEVMKYFINIKGVHETTDLLSPDEDNFSLVAKVNMSCEKLDEAHRRSGLDYSMVNGKSLGWWLRTPGADEKRAVRINCNGAVRLHGRGVDKNLVGVRPAIWVKNYE